MKGVMTLQLSGLFISADVYDVLEEKEHHCIDMMFHFIRRYMVNSPGYNADT